MTALTNVTVNIYSNGIVNGFNGDALVTDISFNVYDGGYLTNNVDGDIDINSGGVVNNINIGEHTNINISAGGILENLNNDQTEGGVTVYANGKMNNCIFTNTFYIHISSAGIASNCIFDSSIELNMKSATTYDCTFRTSNIISAGTGTTLINANIENGTTIKGATIKLGGTSNIFSTGGISSIQSAYTDSDHKVRELIISAGAFHLLSGIQVDGAQVNSGYLHVSSGVTVSNVIVSAPSNNRGIIFSTYGALYNVTVSNGYIYYMNNTSNHTLGGTACNVPQSKIMLNNYSTGIIESSVYISNGVVRNLTLQNTTSNLTRLTINSGLITSSAIVNAGGYLYIKDGGKSLNTTINSGGSTLLCDNVSVINESAILGNRGICSGNNLTISSGGFALYRGSNISGSNVIVSEGGSLRIQNGATVNSLTINSNGSVLIEKTESAYIDNQYSPIVSNLIINQSAIVNIGSNAILNNVSMGSGTLIEPIESASITNLNIVVGAKCDLNSGDEVTSGAKINGSNTNAPEGTLYYQGKPLDCTISNGIVTNLGENGNYYRIQFGSNIVIKQPKVYSGCRIYGQDNCIVSGGSIFTSGNIGLLNTAKGYDVVLGGEGLSNATYNIFDNASAVNTTIYMGGIHQLQSAANAYSSKVVIYSNGIMRVSSGASADDITINIDGLLTIRDGGIASGIVVSSGGSLLINVGGSALGVTANEGAIITNNGYIEYNN